MHYKKIKIKDTIVEFHNNWVGVETIIINGQIVSKKSSVWGAHHRFTLIEDGKEAKYVLTTKVGADFAVLLDLHRNGKTVEENIAVEHGGKPKWPSNKFKKEGIDKLNNYYVDDAIKELNKALEISADDPELYFYLACAYSVKEDLVEGFRNIYLAVKHNLYDKEEILDNDMLAFLRMNEAFEPFFASNYTAFDEQKLKEISKNTPDKEA